MSAVSAPTVGSARQPYPWRLRLVHEGMRSVLIERRGRFVRVDPKARPGADDVVILTGGAPEQRAGVEAAVRAGGRPTVVASPALLAQLSALGPIHGIADPVPVDGLRVELVDAPPAGPSWGPSLRRLRRAFQASPAAQQCFRLTLPDGGTLVFLNTALSEATPAEWVDALAERWARPTWLLAGVEPGHEAALERHLPRFGATHVILTDLVSEVRRAMRLPVGLLTPAADRLAAQGLAAQVFVSGAGLRYEQPGDPAGGM